MLNYAAVSKMQLAAAQFPRALFTICTTFRMLTMPSSLMSAAVNYAAAGAVSPSAKFTACTTSRMFTAPSPYFNNLRRQRGDGAGLAAPLLTGGCFPIGDIPPTPKEYL